MVKRLEFSRKTKIARWEHSGAKCEAVWEGKKCDFPLMPHYVEYHHEKEAEAGGDNSFENCRCVCKPCHKVLTAIFVKGIRKADRQRAGHLGAKAAIANPLQSAPMPQTSQARARAAAREARGPRTLPPRRSIYADR